MSCNILLNLGVMLALTAGNAKGDTKPVAMVGTETITVADFKQVYRQPREEVNIDSLKRAVLDKLVTDKLLLIAARGKEFVEDVEPKLEDYKKRLVVNALYKRMVLERAKVSPWDVRSYWWQLSKEVKASHILIKDKNEAYEVYKRLRLGEDFAALARAYSEDPGSANKGGDLGWFGWGRMEPEFQKVVFSSRPGVISRPVQTRHGYHIIVVIDVREKEKPDFTTEKDRIKRQLEQQKMKELADGYLVHLKKTAHVRYNDAAIREIVKAGARRPGVPEVSEKVKAMTLLSWVGGSVTVDEFLLALKTRPRRMSFDTPEAVEDFLGNWFVIETLLPRAAARHRFEHRPDIKDQIDARRDAMVLQEYRLELESGVEVTADEIEEYYDSHRDEYEEEFERAEYRIRRTLLEEKKSTREEEITAELRNQIPVQVFEDNLKEI